MEKERKSWLFSAEESNFGEIVFGEVQYDKELVRLWGLNKKHVVQLGIW